MFKSDFIERFSYVHPLVPITLWGFVVIVAFSTGLSEGLSLKRSIAIAATGIFVWTLAEYLLHRFVFHFKANTPLERRIEFIIHGVHHEDPTDERRLLMPPAAGAAIAVVFYTLFTLLLGSLVTKPFFAGFIVGYLIYDYTHLGVHHFNPKHPLLKKLKQHHMLHHFVTPDKRFGVSSPLWDYVFGTRG